ncbi:MAG: gamma-glutamyltransferase [Rhodospirillaceae bacterium]
MVLAAAGSLLAGCSSNTPPEGQIGYIAEDFGGVVSDEPRSALIGRDVLSSGGNAVDAAVATYFALAVTYPHAATLGGGGICVVHRGRQGDAEAIDFRPGIVERNGRSAAIPGAVRGMAALHARYGRMQWAALLLPAERLARFGDPVSRALSRQLAEMPDATFSDPGMREIFTANGARLREGELLREVQLASTLARVRLRGAGEFYAGDMARQLAAGIEAISGAGITVEDMRRYLPRWQETARIEVGNHTAHLPAGAEGDRAVAAWRALVGGGAAAVPDTLAGGRTTDSAGFGAVDRDGTGISCVVGSNGLFGAARTIGATGIVAAGADAAMGWPGLPVVIANGPRKDVIGVVTGSGGSGAAIRALSAGVAVFDRDVDPAAALSPGGQGVRTSIIRCPSGAREDAKQCRFHVDPGGFGLAAGATL